MTSLVLAATISIGGCGWFSGPGKTTGVEPKGNQPTSADTGRETPDGSTAATRPGGTTPPPSSIHTTGSAEVARWNLPAPPALNYLAGPGLLASEYPLDGRTVITRAGSNSILYRTVTVSSLLAAVAADRRGGVWYTARLDENALLWSDGRRVQVFPWSSAEQGGPVSDLNLTTDAHGDAWVMFVAPTVPHHTPDNLIGAGDYGGRVVAIHVTRYGTRADYTLPPLVGAGVGSLAVGPDGRVWFTTTQAGSDAVRTLYAFNPGDGTVQPYPFSFLGRVVGIAVTPAGVWIRAEAPSGDPVLIQFDPVSEASATVVESAVAMAAAPDGTLFVAQAHGNTGWIYRIDPSGQLSPNPVATLDRIPLGLAATPVSVWALAAGRLYRIPL